MKAAALLLCLSSLTSCNMLEALDQTSPHRTGPVFLSGNWFEARREAKLEAQAKAKP